MSKIQSGRDENRIPLYENVPLKVPFSIALGISDYCNFRCRYCFHSTDMGEGFKPQMLSLQQFVDRISQIEELLANNGLERIRILSICGAGEPLTNKQLPEMVRYIKERKIADRIEITTNGSLLTHELSDLLIEAGLTRLLISVQGITEEAYKAICGYAVDMQQFLKEIRYFYKKKNQCSLYIKTVDIALKEGEDQIFYDMFAPIADAVNIEKIIKVFDSVDYSSMIEESPSKTRYGYERIEKICCDSLFMRMQIYTNGDVTNCACRYPGLVVGNIYRNSLSEIWNGELHKKYMRLHLAGNRGKIKMCRDCDSMQSAGHPMDNLDGHLGEILERVNKL